VWCQAMGRGEGIQTGSRGRCVGSTEGASGTSVKRKREYDGGRTWAEALAQCRYALVENRGRWRQCAACVEGDGVSRRVSRTVMEERAGSGTEMQP